MSHLTKTALVISAAAVAFTLTGCGGDSNSVTTSTKTVTSTITTQSPTPAKPLKEGLIPGGGIFVLCDDGASGVGTDITSCPFAKEVRQAFLVTHSDAVHVKSPVTKEYYWMYCSAGFIAELRNGERRDAAVCDEKDDALVIVLF